MYLWILYIYYICINGIWYLVVYNGWYAITPNQTLRSLSIEKLKTFEKADMLKKKQQKNELVTWKIYSLNGDCFCIQMFKLII